MKIRAILLIAIMIMGTYAMIQLSLGYDKKELTKVLGVTESPFSLLTFSEPSLSGADPKIWKVDDESEIESLLEFLQDYHVRKLKPKKINKIDDINQFIINLTDKNGDNFSIIVNENLIIQNSSLYYEVVDGPLDMDWIVQFFISNKI
ncbi:MAG TPA: hypothetical protein K8V56_10855 [Sporosarcina psychrophila]|uniref:Uncharacterized protein n=1 Tax=Sporosarcina psychrophila TaxID=1476 RepID=A0A921FZ03_SPOPS|nr:hypothetical protein [Sporosarcina psychrophila]